VEQRRASVSDAVTLRSSNFGMQGTPISVALLRWRAAGAPDAGRLAPEKPMPEIIGIDHIYVAVSDLRQSEAFYDRVMPVLALKKNSFQIDAFTLSPVPGGLRHLVLTCPETEPSMQFVFLGSHFCAQASFRQPLAGLPLPSANSYPDSIGSSYRGLSPHKLMPMSGVHITLERTAGSHPLAAAAQRERWANEKAP
jgi:catechol 2,3-dioxygenase-like lactoylglutathione lyase family enzyme